MSNHSPSQLYFKRRGSPTTMTVRKSDEINYYTNSGTTTINFNRRQERHPRRPRWRGNDIIPMGAHHASDKTPPNMLRICQRRLTGEARRRQQQLTFRPTIRRISTTTMMTINGLIVLIVFTIIVQFGSAFILSMPSYMSVDQDDYSLEGASKSSHTDKTPRLHSRNGNEQHAAVGVDAKHDSFAPIGAEKLRGLVDLLNLAYRVQALDDDARLHKRSPPSYHKWSRLFGSSPLVRGGSPTPSTESQEDQQLQQQQQQQQRHQFDSYERPAPYDKRLVSEREINSVLKNTWLG